MTDKDDVIRSWTRITGATLDGSDKADIELSGHSSFQLASAPPEGLKVHFHNVGECPSGEFRLTFAGVGACDLTLECHADLRVLRFEHESNSEGGGRPSVTLRGAGQKLQIFGGQFQMLALDGVEVTRSTHTQFDGLSLNDGLWQGDQVLVQSLSIAGTSTLATPATADITSFEPEACLVADADCQLGTVVCAVCDGRDQQCGRHRVAFTGDGLVTCHTISMEATVSSVDLVITGEYDNVVKRCHFFSSRKLVVGGELEACQFGDSEWVVALSVSDDADVRDASGYIALSVGDRARLEGSTASNLFVKRVEKVGASELLRVDLSTCPLDSLRRLQSADRVEPILPGWLDSTSASATIDELRETDWKIKPGRRKRQELRESKRHRWHVMQALVSQGRASGSTQARVRCMSKKSRRRSAGLLTTERAVLTVQAVFGYSEKVFMPLIVWLGVLLVLALPAFGEIRATPYIPQHHQTTFDRVAYLASTPLSVVKVTSDDRIKEQLKSVNRVSVARAFGVLLIGTSLVAAKRMSEDSSGQK